MEGCRQKAEVLGGEQDRRPCPRGAEHRRERWECLQAWRQASSPGIGRLRQPRTGCHTGRCWRAAGPPRPPEHRARLGIWLACEEEAWESRRSMW